MSAGSGNADRCGAFGTATGRVCVLDNDHAGEHQLTRTREDDELLASLRSENASLRQRLDRYSKRSDN